MPRISLVRPSLRQLLDGRRCPQHAWPVDACPAQRHAEGRQPATGSTRRSAEYGDLLDVIRESCGLVEFRDVADEARRFLSLPRPEPEPEPEITTRKPPAASGSPDAARRLFAMAKPLAGTLAERYLQARGIPFATREPSLRFHPGCYFRDFSTGRTLTSARADRRHHQLRRSSHRRPTDFPVSHRARPGRGQQGARP